MNLYAPNTELHDVGQVAVANVTGNIAAKRQWILDNLVDEDEWFIMADDNIQKFRAINYPWYCMDQLDEIGTKNEVDITPEMAEGVFAETLQKAEESNARFVGFRTNSNPFFGRKKWNEVSYVSTKLCMIKKDSGIRFNPEFPMRDEVQFTAENLIKYGRVLVNKYLFPVANHYEKGGIGGLDERLVKRKEECRRLMIKYPGLLKFKKNHKSTPEESDVQLRIHTVDKVNDWRMDLVSRGIVGPAHDPMPNTAPDPRAQEYHTVL